MTPKLGGGLDELVHLAEGGSAVSLGRCFFLLERLLLRLERFNLALQLELQLQL